MSKTDFEGFGFARHVARNLAFTILAMLERDDWTVMNLKPNYETGKSDLLFFGDGKVIEESEVDETKEGHDVHVKAEEGKVCVDVSLPAWNLMHFPEGGDLLETSKFRVDAKKLREFLEGENNEKD